MICVLGDAHLDVVVRLTGPLTEETDTPAATSVGVGGQGANVAAWVAALGGRSRLIAARGTDLGAGLVSAELADRGVELVGPVVPAGTGVVVSLSDGGHRRSMLTDRGAGAELGRSGDQPGLAGGLRLAARQRLRVRARADARRGAGRDPRGPRAARRA